MDGRTTHARTCERTHTHARSFTPYPYPRLSSSFSLLPPFGPRSPKFGQVCVCVCALLLLLLLLLPFPPHPTPPSYLYQSRARRRRRRRVSGEVVFLNLWGPKREREIGSGRGAAAPCPALSCLSFFLHDVTVTRPLLSVRLSVGRQASNLLSPYLSLSSSSFFLSIPYYSWFSCPSSSSSSRFHGASKQAGEATEMESLEGGRGERRNGEREGGRMKVKKMIE